jgi:ribosomal protein S18 acetylase RimI-like enzyme
MDALTFRQAGWDELEGKWQALVQAAYHPNYNGMGEEYNAVRTADSKITLMMDYMEGTLVWTAWKDDVLVGLLIALNKAGRLLLYDLFVSSEYRRHGIGRRLVETAIADCQAKVVAAEVNRGNEASQRLFQALNFQRKVTSDWFVLEIPASE